jgi:hypothetical protein
VTQGSKKEEIETCCDRESDVVVHPSPMNVLIFCGSCLVLTTSVNFILPVVNDAMEYYFKDTNYKQAFPEVVWNKVLVVVSKEFMKQGYESISLINSIISHRIDDQHKIWASKFMADLAGVILDSKEISLWNMLETMLGRKVGGMVLLTSSTEPMKIMPLSGPLTILSFEKLDTMVYQCLIISRWWTASFNPPY